jgi:hypothetical protein
MSEEGNEENTIKNNEKIGSEENFEQNKEDHN